LTWHRLQRGWSHEKLAREIKQAMAQDGQTPTGLSRETVRRWETGERRPDSTFRPYLVLVFGLPASELGLLTAEELALRPPESPEAQIGDNELIAQVVAETVKQVLHVMHGDGNVTGRRLVLGRLLEQTWTMPTVVESVSASSSSARPTTSGALDPHAVDEMASIAAAQQRLYYSTEASSLLDAVLPQLQIGVELLSGAQTDSTAFRRLAAAVAQSALLAARLSFFDFGDERLAEDCFELATHAVGASRDHALSVVVQAHRAFVPGFAGNLPDARRYLDAAQAQVRQAPGPLLRSWVHCVTAEIEARTGSPETALTRIRQAEDALTTNGSDPDWLDFFDESRLAGFAGQTYLLASKHTLAVPRLRQALDQLAPDAARQRSVVQLDLAAALAPNDADQAAELAYRALEALTADPYAAAMSRVPQLSVALQATPFAGELEDRVRALPAVPQP
jgi:transcriptional regulator with XRE-family HTH domain